VLRFVLERIAQAIVCLLVVSAIVFLLTRLTGDPVVLMLGDGSTEQDRLNLQKDMGLDQPLPVQYLAYLSKAVRGDFGQSIRTKRPALELVLERLPATLQLGLVSMAISLVLALLLGVNSAVHRGTALDHVGRLIAVLGQSLPSFWLGLILILVFAVWLRLLPTGGSGELRHLILPAVTLGWYNVAVIMRLTRSSMLDVLGAEYIKLARAKGLSESAVIWKHAFRNAALPVVTFSSIVLVVMLGGAVVTESVFAWPGVGRLLMEAITWRDFPLVQTGVMLMSALYVGVNLLVDLLYGYLNPRIRLER